MHNCNLIIILNGATTYLIWHAWFKFSYVPLLTQRKKTNKKKNNCPPYLP